MNSKMFKLFFSGLVTQFHLRHLSTTLRWTFTENWSWGHIANTAYYFYTSASHNYKRQIERFVWTHSGPDKQVSSSVSMLAHCMESDSGAWHWCFLSLCWRPCPFPHQSGMENKQQYQGFLANQGNMSAFYKHSRETWRADKEKKKNRGTPPSPWWLAHAHRRHISHGVHIHALQRLVNHRIAASFSLI